MKSLVFALLLLVSTTTHAAEKYSAVEIERGRYLTQTIGCNDCHTAGYAMKGGDVPVKDWLTGDAVGWKGPWGTTYPSNIRKRLAQMTEKQFITYAKALKTRPPMPWFTLNRMSDRDLRLLYIFVRSLGDDATVIPDGLPPGVQPQTPYMDMTVIMPAVANTK